MKENVEAADAVTTPHFKRLNNTKITQNINTNIREIKRFPANSEII
jgi:hypothetical protein